jgi:hypothetical protein
MAGMMGAIGMGDRKMEGAKPMSMGPEPEPSAASVEAPAIEERNVGDLLVALLPATEPAKVGESTIRVRVRNSAAAPLEQSRVTFDYSMDMPGMAIQRAAAKRIGDGLYEGIVKFTMAGPWSFVVQIERPGQPILRERFVVRVSG